MNDKRGHLEDELPAEKEREGFSFERSPLNELKREVKEYENQNKRS